MRNRAGSLLLRLLFVAGVAFLLERLIVTDEEAIEAVAAEAAEAASKRDFAALEELLAPAFRYGERDRAATLAYVRKTLERYRLSDVRIRLSGIVVTGDQATAYARIRTAALGRPFQVRSDLLMVRTGDGWRLAEARNVSWGR